MGILRRLREWREDKNGTLIGPNIEADSVNTDTLNNGATITDGDGTERQVYIIASGASDPSAADPEDLIFEEQ